ncbi:hypothetical protein VC33_00450 [Pseudomonas fluorescens]|nr:hypothetical protein VC33_00450 [Pseudomonas fluorescens]
MWSSAHVYLGGVELDRTASGNYSDVDMQHAWDSWQSARPELEAIRRRESLLKEKLADCEKSEAALREELAMKLEAYQGAHMMVTDLKADLAAAEQRNATLETELRNIRQSCELSKLRDARIDALLTKPTESVAYQSREIGESDWADCSKEEYDRCGKDPHMDTRVKPTESGASE